MKKPELLDLYSDYLLSSFSLVTATGLSQLIDNGYSHDQISRFLSQKKFSQKDFWKMVKKIIRKIENDAGVLLIDDTIEEKPHTSENAMICWHWDHSNHRSVKGVNILNFVYHTELANGQNISIPVCYEIIEKTVSYFDVKTQKIKRKSAVTKNELLRNRLRNLVQLNQVKFKYVLWDTWFSSKENFEFLAQNLNKFFIGALKGNRKIALSRNEKLEGKFSKIEDLNLQTNRTYKVWIKGLDFEVLLVKQVFTNKDGSTGVLYLVSNDLDLSFHQICTIYQKRWNVETFHKSLKQNAGLEKSPTKYEVTQSNHIFAAMIAFCKLEILKLRENRNHFALKSRLYLKAIKAAFSELQELKKCKPRSLQQLNRSLLAWQ